MALERLDKLVSTAAGISRNDARIAIKTGRVLVDGNMVKDFAQKTDTAAQLSLNGEDITYRKYVYFMLNKPAGILSASNDKQRKTVVDIVAESCRVKGLFPVGRLDKDTTGLLIITNDGDYGHKVISPKSFIEKEYVAAVDKPITEKDIEILSLGVTLADGNKCRPAAVTVLSNDRKEVSIVITEGKYHEIKRILGVVGAGVNSLNRIRIGKLPLDGQLAQGEYRELTEEECDLVLK